MQILLRERVGRVGRARYSMSWSARPSTDGGIVSPSAFAVLRLITNSNLVGCSTGRSPDLAPVRILSTKTAARCQIAMMSDPLLRRRGEGFPFLDDINRVQLDRLVSRAFIVNGAVRNRYGLPGVQDLFRLAVNVQPEVTLDDMSHDHTGMVTAPGLETGGDLYCGIDDLPVGSGQVRSL